MAGHNPSTWLEIPDVIACFVDMEGSTRLSASASPKAMARAYRYFTNTAIRMFHYFESPYIDVKGDGVFALFDGHQTHRALAAVVSFKTFVRDSFTPRIKNIAGQEIGGHFGIDRKTVLVRRLGLRAVNDRTDRQNEVWAGKPINMAAKLASRSTSNTLWVSDRFYKSLVGQKALLSCGCGGTNGPQGLWIQEDVSTDNRFDFATAWVLKSDWCAVHGEEYCREIIDYDVSGR